VATAPQRRRSSTRSAEALNAQGYRLLRQGRYRDAEPLLREAVRLKPGYAYAQYNLGWSLVAQGKAREALKPLHTTARQQPRRWEPQRRLAQAYQQLGESEKARAHSSRAQALR
jgi:Flp pilus assembly protein TadD